MSGALRPLKALVFYQVRPGLSIRLTFHATPGKIRKI